MKCWKSCNNDEITRASFFSFIHGDNQTSGIRKRGEVKEQALLSSSASASATCYLLLSC